VFVVCWDIIRVDIMAAFNSLSCLDSRGFGAVNSALITLLPKKPGAEEVRDFQPISLIHDVAKWVAKVIANRLAPLLSKLVGAHLLACICALLSTASTRVLHNGSPGARVAYRHGLLQGDPISPQLFILVMEALHFALETVT
jgi:hypothetical protein